MNHKLLKEQLASANFLDRPPFQAIAFFPEKNVGILASNGDIWHKNRRFGLRLLRDLGMGKSRLVNLVQKEAQELVKALKKCSGKIQPIPKNMELSVLNIIWQMIAGKVLK